MRYRHQADPGPGGFSVVELLIVLTIVVIITLMALLGTTRARTTIQLNNNSDVLKSYLERAFTDAHKRHASGDARAQVVVTGVSSYTVTVDFDGDGVAETRTIALTDGVKFDYSGTGPQATVDWRGTIAEGSVSFRLKNRQNETTTLNLSSAGDSTDDALPSMPTITATTTSADVVGSTVVNGNSAPNPNPSPTASPTPLPTCTGAQVALTTPCRCATGKTIDAGTGKCK